MTWRYIAYVYNSLGLTLALAQEKAQEAGQRVLCYRLADKGINVLLAPFVATE